MDKCYTLLCVTVFVVSVIHGFTLGYRSAGNIKVLEDEESSVVIANSTFDSLLVLPTTAEATCVHALEASAQQVQAAAAEFQALDAAARAQVADDFRAQINAAFGLFRSCIPECLGQGGGDRVEQPACASALRSQARAWVDASRLYSQHRDLEINRAQLTQSVVSDRWNSSGSS